MSTRRWPLARRPSDWGAPTAGGEPLSGSKASKPSSTCCGVSCRPSWPRRALHRSQRSAPRHSSRETDRASSRKLVRKGRTMLHAAKVFGRLSCVSIVVAIALLAWVSPAQARVKKIVVDKKVSPAFDGASFGAAGQYETLAGRAFGELDPNDPHNAVITDIRLAPKNANGKVEYVATFFLVKPIDMSKSSHLMWEDVPNRGGRITIVVAERNEGDIGLSAGWQGDNSGNTAPGPNNDYGVVPVAKNPDGSPVTGLVIGRIVNVSGPGSQSMFVQTNPMPYKPMSPDTT